MPLPRLVSLLIASIALCSLATGKDKRFVTSGNRAGQFLPRKPENKRPFLMFLMDNVTHCSITFISIPDERFGSSRCKSAYAFNRTTSMIQVLA